MMKFTMRRTVAAFLLTSAAVGLPSLAWYLAGTHSVEKEIRLMEQAAEMKSFGLAQRLADNMANRLNTLRAGENKRPFYQYQSLYHDPKGAYDGPSIVPSPLAEGPSDPLVWAHFQMAPGGDLTLPTLNDVDPGITSETIRATQTEAMTALSSCETFCMVSLKEMEENRRKSRLNQAALSGLLPQEARVLLAMEKEEQRPRVEVMDRTAWLQNQQAGQLYADLKGIPAKGGCVLSDRKKFEDIAAEKGQVEITIGPFEWRTMPIEGFPALAALRMVETPDGMFVQGFTVATTAVDTWLNNQDIPARLVPAGTTNGIEAPLPILGADWAISVQPGEDAVGSADSAALMRSSFKQEFWLFSLGAWIVGMSVVGLVWQAEKVSHQRSRFAASAAHELRTPLAGMQLYSEMLAEGIGKPEKADEYARRIASEASRLGRVVTNVLGFTRLEKGAVTANPQPGNLAAGVRESVARQEPTLTMAGLEVRLDLPDGLPSAMFDADALCNIIQNLLDNAEKYGRGCDHRTVDIRLYATDGVQVVSIRDYGPGIPREQHKRLFQPFERGVRSDDAPSGIGLGLVLCRALARAQGAEISCHEADGGGAEFQVRFKQA